jgi:hypothetical protein
MTQEAYCSFEVAKLLKGKGFLQDVNLRMIQNLSYYDNIGLCHNLSKYYDSLIQDKIDFVIAPTHQMACAWLRERNIGIVPEIHTTQDPKNYYWSACIFYLNKPWDILHYVSEPSKNVIDGYNGVIEQALKYSLEKLI